MPEATASPGAPRPAAWLPGLALAVAVALAAMALEPWLRRTFGASLPGMVLALVIGILLNPIARNPVFKAGFDLAVKRLLRYAIALLGLRIALSDIAGLGWPAALLAILAMAATVAGAMMLARLLGLGRGYGALAGAACAVCGASATLATATVVPDYREKAADIAFTVVMANALSTVVMLAYPPLALALGLDIRETGLFLGLTIHDMAQVVGAGYAVSEPVGNNAVIVKLFRVFLLLPVVLGIGWVLARQEGGDGGSKARVPLPGFALVFLLLVVVNSVLPGTALAATYASVKGVLSSLSGWLMMIAIAALGLGTSAGAVLATGWRHLAVFLGATLIILALALAGLFAMRVL